MIRIQQIKLKLDHTQEDLEKSILKLLHCKKEQINSWKIIRKSIDARKKEDICYIYTVDIDITNEKNIFSKVNNKNIMLTIEEGYKFPKPGKEPLKHRPVIIGTGPAGLFCAYFLAKLGYRPLVIERGEAVEERVKTVNHFWSTNYLNPESNVQFGEGGAGTFSDGKLNTLVKDKSGRNKLVLETFVENGAEPEILYMNKPHIGTDVLCRIVKNMRNEIISQGGEIRFNSKLTDILIEDNAVTSIEINGAETIDCEILVLAVGHSARDTFEMLAGRNIKMEQKAFAIGVRIEHPQEMISISQYGKSSYEKLPPAEYKLAGHASNGRNVYSFCMCPGGYVVDASSEQGRLAVNGMSNSKRDACNANSAIIVSVTEADFPDRSPLAGISFVREIEEKAFLAGRGNIPVQLFSDFENKRVSSSFGEILPCTKGNVSFADLNSILPEYICKALAEGVHQFARNIKGFNRGDCILSGVETRTSSPVRIPRDENMQSSVHGIYPCGEGAGYAGGITSAAMDGIKIFEFLIKKHDDFK